MLASLDAFIASLPEPRPTRPEAIRRLTVESLRSHTAPKPDEGYTFAHLIEAERTLLLEAPERYGAAFQNAQELTSLFSTFIASIEPNAELFVRWMSQANKHQVLALLSASRRHRVQATMNLRQVIEASCQAAFAMEHREPESVFRRDDQGEPTLRKKHIARSYEWVKRNFPNENQILETLNKHISESSAHAYITSSNANFAHAVDSGRMDTTFFDVPDDFVERGALLQVAGVALNAVNLLLSANTRFPCFQIKPSCLSDLRRLALGTQRIQEEMMRSERFRSAVGLTASDHESQ